MAWSVVSTGLVMGACAGPVDGPESVAPDRRAEFEARAGWWESYAACLTDKGFPTRATRDGMQGLGSQEEYANAEQLDADYDRADGECLQEIGDMPVAAPLTDGELRQLYEDSLETAECLRRYGEQPGTPPSFEKFASDYRSRGVAIPWSPYQTVQTTDLEAFCPQPTLDY